MASASLRWETTYGLSIREGCCHSKQETVKHRLRRIEGMRSLWLHPLCAPLSTTRALSSARLRMKPNAPPPQLVMSPDGYSVRQDRSTKAKVCPQLPDVHIAGLTSRTNRERCRRPGRLSHRHRRRSEPDRPESLARCRHAATGNEQSVAGLR